MTLPICASSLASPSWSRRAISELLQRRWNGQRLERIRGAVEVQHGVEHRLREFFDEQRDAARLLEDRMHDGSRQGAFTQHRAQEAGAGCSVKRFERDRRAALNSPGRREFGPVRHQQEHPHPRHTVDEHRQEIERRGVGPMRVLQQDQDRRGEQGAFSCLLNDARLSA